MAVPVKTGPETPHIRGRYFGNSLSSVVCAVNMMTALGRARSCSHAVSA